VSSPIAHREVRGRLGGASPARPFNRKAGFERANIRWQNGAIHRLDPEQLTHVAKQDRAEGEGRLHVYLHAAENPRGIKGSVL
jgi:hypothetical protein